MAHDLLFGQTSRDWSCGGSAHAPAPEQTQDRLPETPRLAEAARSEMSKTATAAIRLRRRGLLPDADWRGFGRMHRQWLALSDARRGRWREADALPLQNLREACGKFAEKLKKLSELSRPGSKALVPASSPPAPAPRGGGPWYAVLGAALALAGVGIFTSARGR